jgi:hypothetical protein
MKSRLLALAVVAATLVCFVTLPASAQNGYCGNGYGYGYGLGYLYGSLDYNVPYFAAHPPVYYSYPVPRTYGYSPFAYPPGVMTPEVVQEVKPVQIVNPYVPKVEKTPQEPERDRAVKADRQPQPLVVVNPYFRPTRTVAQSAL